MNDDGLAVMNAPTARERTAGSHTAASSWLGWTPLLLLPPLVLVFAPAEWPSWLVMWVLSVVIFAGCKWLTWSGGPVTDAPNWLHIAFFLGWPGLDAVHFLARGRRTVRQPNLSEWFFATGKLALGLILIFAVARFVPSSQPYLIGWIGMIGVVLLLHFGLFHLLSCYWRSVGIDAQPLMNWPLAAVSLSEFWSRRWNTAFRDLTHRFLFVPLTNWCGAAGAVLVGFLFSGLVHDAVISLPAGGGYGGPTLFFALQGVGLLIERTKIGRWIGLGKGWRGRLFTLLFLLIPAPLLFHPPFVTQVVVPFLQAIGAV